MKVYNLARILQEEYTPGSSKCFSKNLPWLTKTKPTFQGRNFTYLEDLPAEKNPLGWCPPSCNSQLWMARWVIPLGFATTSSQQRMDVPLCLGAVFASKVDPKESWRTGHHVWYAWVSQASSLDRYFFWYTWSCSRKTASRQTVSYSEIAQLSYLHLLRGHGLSGRFGYHEPWCELILG